MLRITRVETKSLSVKLGAIAFGVSVQIATIPLGLAHGPAATGSDASETTPRHIVFPDTAQFKTLVVDLHTHSVFSDGHVWPKIRVAEALRDGLDAMAVTEHLEYQPHRADIPHEDRNRAIVAAQEAAAGSDLIIVAGSEITRQFPAGHINAVFIEDANALFQVDNAPEDVSDASAYYTQANKWPAQNAVDAAHSQGAFIFWNHPYWTAQKPDGIARMNKFHRANIKSDKLHGIEIANGQDYSAEAHAIALKYDLALIGVSDVHDLIDWDYEPHNGGHRPVNLVLATDKSAAALKQALFEKRTLVWFRNILIGRKPEMDAMLSASLSITTASYRTGTEVLDVTIENVSDASFELKNMTKMTFMDHADRIVVAPNTTTKITVKPGKLAKQIELKFEVQNALLAPGKHPRISLTATPQ
jgi:predicted metal-dependent phosphoesterase TrpH